MTVASDDGQPRLLPVDPGFTIQAEIADRVVKGEDLVFVHRADPGMVGRLLPADVAGEPSEWRLNYDVFCVCDGHSGVRAAQYVRDNFLATLHPRMPKEVPSSFRSKRGALFARAVRGALSATLQKLNRDYSQLEELSGCTCTVAVVTGQLLTVANLGDSDAILDCFNEVHKMSVPHRVNDNLLERKRVRAAGSYMAPISINMTGAAKPGEDGVGPMRIWPGGLCVSRGIGDVDVGPVVIATPHIRQVVIPSMGARLVLASDGVWDCIPPKMVVRAAKRLGAASAAAAIVEKCLRVKQGFLIDDTSVIVVDFVPTGVASFKGYNPQKMLMEGSLNMMTNKSCSASAPQWFAPPRDASVRGPSILQPATITEVSITMPVAPTALGAENSAAAANLPEGAPQEGPTPPPPRPAPRPHKPSAFCGCFSSSPPLVLDEMNEMQSMRSGVASTSAPKQGTLEGSSRGSMGSLQQNMLGGAMSYSNRGDSASVRGGTGGGSQRGGSFFSRISSSVHGGRATPSLPTVTLFADVDMEYDETTEDAIVAGSEGSSARPQASPKDDLDMGFEPTPPGSAKSQDAPLWHSMPPTSSEYTTRPHRTGPAGSAMLLAQ